MKLENLWKSPFSSIIGVAMLLYTFYLIHTGKTTVTEALPLISFALYGLGKKDPNVGEGSGLVPMVLLCCLALPFGCRSVKSQKKEISKDSVSVLVKERKQDVKVEGAQVNFNAALKCDSLGNVKWNEGWLAAFDQLNDEPHWGFEKSYTKPKNETSAQKNTVTVKGRNGAFATLKLDSSGRLSVSAGCDSLLRQVTVKDSVIKQLRFRSLFEVQEKEVKVTPIWNWLLIGFLLTVIGILLFRQFFYIG